MRDKRQWNQEEEEKRRRELELERAGDKGKEGSNNEVIALLPVGSRVKEEDMEEEDSGKNA